MCVNMHTHTRTYTHTRSLSCTHTHKHTHTHTQSKGTAGCRHAIPSVRASSHMSDQTPVVWGPLHTPLHIHTTKHTHTHTPAAVVRTHPQCTQSILRGQINGVVEERRDTGSMADG